MEPFESQGHWWIPDRRERCAGTLRCNESGELHLHLFSSWGTPGGSVDKRFPVIYGELVGLAGVTRTAPKGDFVTLLHSIVSNEMLTSSGSGTQTLFAHRAFFGSTLLSSDGERISRVAVADML